MEWEFLHVRKPDAKPVLDFFVQLRLEYLKVFGRGVDFNCTCHSSVPRLEIRWYGREQWNAKGRTSGDCNIATNSCAFFQKIHIYKWWFSIDMLEYRSKQIRNLDVDCQGFGLDSSRNPTTLHLHLKMSILSKVYQSWCGRWYIPKGIFSMLELFFLCFNVSTTSWSKLKLTYFKVNGEYYLNLAPVTCMRKIQVPSGQGCMGSLAGWFLVRSWGFVGKEDW